MLVYLIAEDLWLWVYAVYGLWFMVYLYCVFVYQYTICDEVICLWIWRGYMYGPCMAWIIWIYRRHVFDITLISFMLQQNLDVAAYI